MSMRTLRLLESVRNEQEARAVITQLLLQFGSQAAVDRASIHARVARQTVQELARRTATNVLRNFVVRKPGGVVMDPYDW